ncbi:MAG: hypothetical protein AAGF11_22210 [Myxococcota bacterium]
MQDNQPLDVRIDFKTQRILLFAGLVGSVTVVVCNTIMGSYGELDDWSQWSMNLAYWAGSIGLAFAGLGFVPTYVALRPAGFMWAAPPAALLGYFLALGSAGHGSFFAHYSAVQAVNAAAEDPAILPALEALRSTLALYNLVMFLVPVSVLLIGSMWFSITVLTRPTLYPRWMAAWNIFVIALVTFVIGELEFLPDLIQLVFRGLGFHLGISGYFLLSLHFLSKHNRSSVPSP